MSERERVLRRVSGEDPALREISRVDIGPNRPASTRESPFRTLGRGFSVIGGGIRSRVGERLQERRENQAIYKENYREAKRRAIAQRARREAYASEAPGRGRGVGGTLSSIGSALNATASTLNYGNPAVTGGLGMDFDFGGGSSPRRRRTTHKKKSVTRKAKRSGRSITINL